MILSKNGVLNKQQLYTTAIVLVPFCFYLLFPTNFIGTVTSFHSSNMMKQTTAVHTSSAMTSRTTTNINYNDIRQSVPYIVPDWCQKYFVNVPSNGRLHLANLPTPLYRINFYNHHRDEISHTSLSSSTWNYRTVLDDLNCTLYIKRDDCTSGVELGGNKVRKLEFLLADAIAHQHDSIITIGGIQSNHCRATACAARMVGLESHLILRKGLTRNSDEPSKSSSNSDVDDDVGLVGNLLFDRMVGSHIYTCSPGEYGRIGSDALLSRVCRYIHQSKGGNPYIIPVGGSNGIGTWGYINAVDEMISQWNDIGEISLDHVVVACGSGGTTAGITLGMALVSKSTTIHAVGVCDNEEYFYNHISKIADDMGFILPSDDSYSNTQEFIRSHLVIHQGKGRGYALSTKEEYEFILQFSKDTGIVLDPVYTGKALYNFMNYIKSNPERFRNKNILFWHTGGALGLFDKCNDLNKSLQIHSTCQRLDIYGNGNGLPITDS